MNAATVSGAPSVPVGPHMLERSAANFASHQLPATDPHPSECATNSNTSRSSDMANASLEHTYPERVPNAQCPSCQEASSSPDSNSLATELAELRIKQHHLERKNLLLEKLLHMNSKQKVQHNGWADNGWGEFFAPYQEAAANSTDIVTISLGGQQHKLTVHDVSQLSMHQFAKIWTAYIRRLLDQLLQLNHSKCSNLRQEIEEATAECVKLVTCVCVVNPSVMIGAMEGKVDEQLAAKTRQQDHQLTCLKQINLSEQQIQDMVYIRRLYFLRKGLLQAQRQTHLDSVGNCSKQSMHPQQTLGKLSDVAQVLKQTALQDVQVYHNVGHALGWGILTRMQVAVWIVHLYPYIPVLEEVLEAVATARHEPSKDDVMAMAQQDPMNSEWAELEEYVEMVVAEDPHAYVPVPRGVASSCTSSGARS